MSTFSLPVSSTTALANSGTWITDGGAVTAILSDASDSTRMRKTSTGAGDYVIFPTTDLTLPANEYILSVTANARMGIGTRSGPVSVALSEWYSAGDATTGGTVGPFTTSNFGFGYFTSSGGALLVRPKTGTAWTTAAVNACALRFADASPGLSPSLGTFTQFTEASISVVGASIPLAPTVSAPSGSVTTTATPTIVWTHNDLSVATVTTKALTSNVVTITTSAAHGFLVGNDVTVALTTPDPVFDGTYKITSVTSTTFTYAKTNANVTSVGAPGTASFGDSGKQVYYQAAVFSATQYGVAGFDPASSLSTWASGIVSSSTTNVAPSGLTNGLTYRAYVRTAKQQAGSAPVWGPWSFSGFSLALIAAPSPTIVAALDATNARVGLTIAGFGNVLSDDDSGFEGTVGSWIANLNCSVARTTAQAFSGTASLGVTITGAGVFNAVTSGRYSVTAGATYSATAQSRAATTVRGMFVGIAWWDATGTLVTTSTGTVVANTNVGWTTITVTAVAPATAVTASPTVQSNGGAAAEVHYFDQVAMHPGSTPTFSPGGATYSFLVNRLGNLLTADDASFESSAGTWIGATASTVARVPGIASLGAGSLAITATAAATVLARTTAFYSVSAGAPYSLVADIRAAATPRSMVAGIAWWDASGTFITTNYSAGTTDSTSSWTTYTVTATAPGGAAFATPVVQTNATPGIGEIHYADKIAIIPGSTPTWVAGGTGSIAVRPGKFVGNAAQQITVYDYEAPRGVKFSYSVQQTATFAAGAVPTLTVISNDITMTNDGAWWLKSSANSSLNRGGIRVLIAPAESRAENLGVYRADGRADPIIVAGQSFLDDISFEIYTSSAAEYEAVLALVTAQTTLLLQEPFTDSSGFGLQRYIRITGRSWTKEGVPGAPRRVFSVSAITVGQGF